MSPSFAKQCWYMTRRSVMALLRQPWFIGITLVQPIIWLLLFGALFKSVVQIPGFQADSYYDFLVPGVAIMTAVFGAGWSGMGILDDLDRGVIDRFLTSPVRRVPLIVGPIAQVLISVSVQALIIIGLGALVGASYPGGVGGILVMILCSCLLAAAIGGCSNAIALLSRQEETMIGVVTFFTLPLTFLSSTFMQLSLAPNWIETVAKFNPVNWAVVASRSAVSEAADWGAIATRVAGLAAIAALCVFWATSAFRTYQKSI
jgi:ABC-2 type transport system permease protein